MSTFDNGTARAQGAQPDAPRELEVTFFANHFAKDRSQRRMTWSALTETLRDPKQFAAKATCPMIKLAEFGDLASQRMSLRSDANLQLVHGLEGDYDCGQVSVQQAAAMLQAAGVEALIYSSASHQPHFPRWRVLAPLSQPCSPDQRRELVGRLNTALGGILSPESFTASQCYYYGRVVGVPYEFASSAGVEIDRLFLEATYPNQAPALEKRPEMDSDARDFERHVMLCQVTDETFGQLASALERIPADDRTLWIRMGQALASFKGSEHEDRAHRLWVAWSARSSKFDPDTDPARWYGFKADRTGFPAVFKEAMRHGWINGSRVDADTPDSAQKLAAATAALRGMDPKDALDRWAELAVGLSAEHEQCFVAEVARLTGVGVRALTASLKAVKATADKVRRMETIEARAAGRKVIEYQPENRTEHALQVEQEIVAKAEMGAYLQFGGQLARITVRPFVGTRRVDQDMPPETPQVELLDDVGALAEAERVVMFTRASKDGLLPIAVPSDVIDVLLKKRKHLAPIVTGLVTHPIVIPGSGEILSGGGLHAATGLYLHGKAIDGVQAFAQEEAAHALSRIRKSFLEGFEFASALDADIAVAGLLTGIQRKVCESAPGLAAIAGVQASGKTTLVRRAHIVLTGHDMPVTSFPDRDEAELQKRLLSMLLRAPAIVCFDNIMDGTTFKSGPLAAAMTAPVLVQRLLGASRDTECPTNVLFAITGNNLSLGPDELTRWLVCRLQPAAAQPERRTFKQPDVVGHALAIRDAVLRDAVGIVAGYLRSGTQLSSASRFPTWDRVVRQPLLWAGGEDVAKCFQANANDSEELQAHGALVGCLYTLFGDKPFSASAVAALASSSYLGYSTIALGGVSLAEDEDPFDDKPPTRVGLEADARFDELNRTELRGALRTALRNLQSKDPSSEASVGRVLKAHVDRQAAVETAAGTVYVKLNSRMRRGANVYSLAK